MFEGPLRMMAVLASVVVAASFVLFASDELTMASGDSQAGVRSGEVVMAADEREERPVEQSTGLRRAVDDASEFLLAPFAGFVESRSEWANRGVPTLLGLLLYGFGLGYLARYARGHG